MGRKGVLLFSWVILVTLSWSVSAEPTLAWSKTYDGGGYYNYDYGFAVAVDSLNNVIVSGVSSMGRVDGSKSASLDYYTIKYDSNGNELWTAAYDGGGYDEGRAVAVDSLNNVIVTGRSSVSGSKPYDFVTVKYDSNGNELWTVSADKGYGGQACAITVDSHDNIIVSSYSDYDYYTIKYDSNGNELWTVSSDSGGKDYGMGVAVDSLDNVIVTGYCYSCGGIYHNYYTVKYDSNGNELWTTTYDGGTSEMGASVATDSLDNIIVTGQKTTIKYDSNGNVIWTSNSYGRAVTVDSHDNIIVSGSLHIGYHPVYSHDFDYHTIKFDSNGNELWAVAYDGEPTTEHAWGVALDSNDNVIVGGASCKESIPSVGRNCDYLTIKYTEITDADGDDVLDDIDACLNTEEGAVVNPEGCSIVQLCPADAAYKNHGEYVSCITHAANEFKKSGLITGSDKDAIVSEAAKSDIGKKAKK